MQRTTIDIDFQKKFTWRQLPFNTLINKIRQCPHLYSIEAHHSPSTNGIHVILWCKQTNCQKCRISFDDQNRLSYDTKLRKPHQQNVLFHKYKIGNLNL